MATTKRANGGTKKSGSALGAGGVRYGVYARDKFSCIYCGAVHVALTLDHVECQSHGGDDSAENYVTACYSCNSARQNRSDAVFFAALESQGVDTRGLIGRITRASARRVDRELGKALEIAGKRGRAASKRAGGTEMQGHIAASRAARRAWLSK